MVTSPCLWSVCRCFVTWGWRSPSCSAISPTARGEAPSSSTIRSRFGSTSAASTPWSTAKVWLVVYIHGKEYFTRNGARRAPPRTHLRRLARNDLGALDHARGHRAVVGARRLLDKGQPNRAPAGRRARLRDDGNGARAGRVHEERRDAPDDRVAQDL